MKDSLDKTVAAFKRYQARKLLVPKTREEVERAEKKARQGTAKT